MVKRKPKSTPPPGRGSSPPSSGGRKAISSAPSRGKGRRDSAVATALEAAVHQPPLVLVVDDLPDNREMYVEFLEYSGYAVLSASDGKRAVELARERRPDVILMDISLPIIDGLAAARML